MENNPQQKKSFFFAYGSPQFVLGATLLNIFLNSDDNERKGLLKILGFIVMVIVMGFFTIIGIKLIKEKLDEPKRIAEQIETAKFIKNINIQNRKAEIQFKHVMDSLNKHK